MSRQTSDPLAHRGSDTHIDLPLDGVMMPQEDELEGEVDPSTGCVRSDSGATRSIGNGAERCS